MEKCWFPPHFSNEGVWYHDTLSPNYHDISTRGFDQIRPMSCQMVDWSLSHESRLYHRSSLPGSWEMLQLGLRHGLQDAARIGRLVKVLDSRYLELVPLALRVVRRIMQTSFPIFFSRLMDEKWFSCTKLLRSQICLLTIQKQGLAREILLKPAICKWGLGYLVFKWCYC